MFVAAQGDMLEMAKTAQVEISSCSNPPFPITLHEAFNLCRSCWLELMNRHQPTTPKVCKKKTCHLYCTRLHLGYHRLFLQISMNVLALKPTIVT